MSVVCVTVLALCLGGHTLTCQRVKKSHPFSDSGTPPSPSFENGMDRRAVATRLLGPSLPSPGPSQGRGHLGGPLQRINFRAALNTYEPKFGYHLPSTLRFPKKYSPPTHTRVWSAPQTGYRSSLAVHWQGHTATGLQAVAAFGMCIVPSVKFPCLDCRANVSNPGQQTQQQLKLLRSCPHLPAQQQYPALRGSTPVRHAALSCPR